MPDENLEEPFLILGFGVNAYFDILSSLTYLFLMISLFVIPIFIFYSRGQHYTGVHNPITKLFIGNFGAVTMFAKAVRFANERMDIYCPRGTVLDANNAHFGILSNEFNSFIYCHKSSV